MLRSPNTSVILVFLFTLAGCGGRTADSEPTSVSIGGSPAVFAGTGGVSAVHTGGSAGGGSEPLDAALDFDGSACAVFQPESVWPPTSTSFSIGFGYYGDACHGGEYEFSKADRTLSGTTCLAGNTNYTPSYWLVHLAQAQVDAIIAAVGSVQTVCEVNPQCMYYREAGSLLVYGQDPNASPASFETCVQRGFSDAGMFAIPQPPYMDFGQLYDLVVTLSSTIAATCAPDAGGGDLAVCVPLPWNYWLPDAGA